MWWVWFKDDLNTNSTRTAKHSLKLSGKETARSVQLLALVGGFEDDVFDLIRDRLV